MYANHVKRVLDIIGAVILMPIFLVALIVCGPCIFMEDKGDIFYKAKRRGYKGKTFNMLKFRSMKMDAPDLRNKDDSTFNSEKDTRITKVGKVLRKTSIDEVPQIVNVFKGDMSFIGPRPTMATKPMSEYDQKRIDRLQVKPGITGYSQAYYRNSLDQESKMELDAEYAKNVSFPLDVKIFLKTIETVIKRKNIYKKEV